MLGLSILGYPAPTLLAWGEEGNHDFQIDQGTHIIAKITKLREYLEQIAPPAGDDDIVLVADGYDSWFQLRSDVLIKRYYAINAAANSRLKRRLGKRTMQKAEINQRVIFSAAKACSNQPHTLACYPVPEPYTPRDLYGGNTDTVIGRNKHYSSRPKYLASGYMMGPVKDLREILQRAQHKMNNLPDFDRENDNGSGTSDFLYHGDDSSVFARVFGEQEYQREVLRRKYSGATSLPGRMFGQRADSAGRVTYEGTTVKDILNPPFTHERMPDYIPDERLYEFGIGLDYGGDIGTNTLNSERDYSYIIHSTSHSDVMGEAPKELGHQQERDHRPRPEEAKGVNQQVQEYWPERSEFDCAIRAQNDSLPRDISRSLKPYAAAPQIIVTMDGGVSPQDAPSNMTWSQVKLYTNLCLGSVPVVIHHNGDRDLRDRDWDKIWWQRYGSSLLDVAKSTKTKPQKWIRGWPGEEDDGNYLREERSTGVGAWSDKGFWVQWDDMCPLEYEDHLFKGSS